MIYKFMREYLIYFISIFVYFNVFCSEKKQCTVIIKVYSKIEIEEINKNGIELVEINFKIEKKNYTSEEFINILDAKFKKFINKEDEGENNEDILDEKENSFDENKKNIFKMLNNLSSEKPIDIGKFIEKTKIKTYSQLLKEYEILKYGESDFDVEEKKNIDLTDLSKFVITFSFKINDEYNYKFSDLKIQDKFLQEISSICEFQKEEINSKIKEEIVVLNNFLNKKKLFIPNGDIKDVVIFLKLKILEILFVKNEYISIYSICRIDYDIYFPEHTCAANNGFENFFSFNIEYLAPIKTTIKLKINENDDKIFKEFNFEFNINSYYNESIYVKREDHSFLRMVNIIDEIIKTNIIQNDNIKKNIIPNLDCGHILILRVNGDIIKNYDKYCDYGTEIEDVLKNRIITNPIDIEILCISDTYVKDEAIIKDEIKVKEKIKDEIKEKEVGKESYPRRRLKKRCPKVYKFLLELDKKTGKYELNEKVNKNNKDENNEKVEEDVIKKEVNKDNTEENNEKVEEDVIKKEDEEDKNTEIVEEDKKDTEDKNNNKNDNIMNVEEDKINKKNLNDLNNIIENTNNDQRNINNDQRNINKDRRNINSDNKSNNKGQKSEKGINNGCCCCGCCC